MRGAGEKPFLRYSADVHPQLLFKRAFGEFSARPSGSGSLTLPQRWIDRHIVTESVPLLGSVRCHRELVPMLRGAMRELRRRGLGSTIHDYGGCFNARTISDDPAHRLSHHSWGAAVDINVGDNCFGCSPHQDPRFVRVMREHGFTWGGRWVRPDGMHFEWWR
jgi:D-alanyl-D-alanine carboxypeptidase